MYDGAMETSRSIWWTSIQKPAPLAKIHLRYDQLKFEDLKMGSIAVAGGYGGGQCFPPPAGPICRLILQLGVWNKSETPIMALERPIKNFDADLAKIGRLRKILAPI